MKLPSKHYRELYQLFAAVKGEKEMEKLMNDLLTPQELVAIAERVQILKQLRLGKPQRQIAADLGVSISTITRGSRVSQFGNGIVDDLLKKIA